MRDGADHTIRRQIIILVKIIVSRIQGFWFLTWPVGDQTVSALRFHLDVSAAGRLQRQDMRSVRGLADLLPETPALQRAGDQPTTGKRAGCCPWDVAQRRHWTPGEIRKL